MAVEAFDDGSRRAGDGRLESGGAQAALLFELQSFALDELGIDEHHQLAGVAPKDPLGSAGGPGKIFTKIEPKGNLIPDGGFEATDPDEILPPGWQVVKGIAAIAEGNAASGKRCLRLSGGREGGPAEALGPMTEIDPEQDYLLYGYLRSGDPRQRLSLGLRYFDAAKKSLRTDFPAACQVFAPGTWSHFQAVVFSSGNTFSLPENVRYVRVVATGSFPKGSSSWFDDLTLVKVRK